MTSRITGYGVGAPVVSIAPVPKKSITVPTSTTAYDFGQLVYYPSGPTWYIYSGGSSYYPFAGAGTILGTANQIVVTNSGGVDTLSLSSTLIAPGSVTVTSGFTVSAGAITMASGTSAINISADAAATNINFGTGAGAKTIVIGSTTAASSIALQSGTGLVAVTTALVSSATTPATLNARVGQATFTAFTTASGATEVVTINNNIVVATSSLQVSIANVGSNDAQMTIQRVLPQAGAIVLYIKNNGAAALNGDLMINFWVTN